MHSLSPPPIVYAHARAILYPIHPLPVPPHPSPTTRETRSQSRNFITPHQRMPTTPHLRINLHSPADHSAGLTRTPGCVGLNAPLLIVRSERNVINAVFELKRRPTVIERARCHARPTYKARRHALRCKFGFSPHSDAARARNSLPASRSVLRTPNKHCPAPPPRVNPRRAAQARADRAPAHVASSCPARHRRPSFGRAGPSRCRETELPSWPCDNLAVF